MYQNSNQRHNTQEASEKRNTKNNSQYYKQAMNVPRNMLAGSLLFLKIKIVNLIESNVRHSKAF